MKLSASVAYAMISCLAISVDSTSQELQMDRRTEDKYDNLWDFWQSDDDEGFWDFIWAQDDDDSLETEHPAFAPTHAPSNDSVSSPATLPTLAPTHVPSLCSFSPSSNSSLSRPVQVQSVPSGSKLTCVPDEEGLFGSVRGNEIVVDFVFEVETTLDAPTDVLPDVERAMTDTVLVGLFPDKCAPRPKHAGLHLASTLFGVGIPQVSQLDGAICNNSIKAEGNTCIVVIGKMKLYVDNSDGDEAEKEAALQTLRRENFQNVNDGIVRVTPYMRPLVPEPTIGEAPSFPDPPQPSRDEKDSGSSKPGHWLWAIPVGLALTVVISFVYIRSRKEKHGTTYEIENNNIDLEELNYDNNDDDGTITSASVYTSCAPVSHVYLYV